MELADFLVILQDEMKPPAKQGRGPFVLDFPPRMWYPVNKKRKGTPTDGAPSRSEVIFRNNRLGLAAKGGYFFI